MRKSRLKLTLKEVDQNRQTLVRPKPLVEASPREEVSDQIYTALYTKLAPGKKRKNKSFADGSLRVTAGISCVLEDEVTGISLADHGLSRVIPTQADNSQVYAGWQGHREEEAQADRHHCRGL